MTSQRKKENKLIKRGLTKILSSRKMTLAEAKRSAYALIDKWHQSENKR